MPTLEARGIPQKAVNLKKATTLTYLENLNALTRNFQMNSLSSHEVCRLVALTLFPSNPASAAAIVELDEEGTYSLKSAFGLTDQERAQWRGIPISQNSPVMDAVRTGQVVCVAGYEDEVARYPGSWGVATGADLAPIITVPLRKYGSTIGALAILGSDVILTDDCVVYLEIVAGLVALALQSNERQIRDTKLTVREALAGQLLTSREELVQALMSTGKTNREIAEDLSFSESTIRQDAISLFSKLGVKTRREAGNLLKET